MGCLYLSVLILATLFVRTPARPEGSFESGFLVEMFDARQNTLDTECGYESCPAPISNMLNVHLVPHSHDDVGWLKTLDQYYYGSKTKYQRAGVQYILDSVVQELLKDPKRRFIYVESAFFFKWWDEQTPELQEAVHELVQRGQLEFVGGAWSMNDEAASHYQSLIDQFSWGLKLLNDTFGQCGRPRAGWQIDPFGHSREQASLFAQMGYDGLFFARLDWNDKGKRLQNKAAEMIWKSSANLEENNELFTSVLYNHYSAPPGFCFDVLCSDDPIVDGTNRGENNVDLKVDLFQQFVTGMSERYQTNNVLITMGDDFNYMDAHMYFKNMDKLIKYVNERQIFKSKQRVNVFYSTPTCYLKALNNSKVTWPTKTDDFFPYASDPHAYWTGYFTSRPTSKRFERVGNHFLQVCKQLTALGPNPMDTHHETHLDRLREAMGVLQHHDAITGTEKQHVADDYARMLHAAIKGCTENTNDALINLTHPAMETMKFESCQLLNISQCDISEMKETFLVTLYNPLGHSIDQYVRLPVNGNNYAVLDYQGNKLPIQIVPLPSPVVDLEYRLNLATRELVFLASEVPPFGYSSFHVSEVYDFNPRADTTPQSRQGAVSIGNEYLSVSFDENGFLNQIIVDGQSHRLQQNFLYYEGAFGNNEVFENRSSGAYILRPNGMEKPLAKVVRTNVYKGEHVQEVQQVFNDWVSQVVRVYENEQHVEFEWMIGPIPIDDDKGKEIITRYYSDIQSNGEFWTDSNGREMLKRVRNHRETWDLDLKEPVAGNYYPITAKIALEDSRARMAVLNDRAQGGTSLQDGVIEVMLHRRLLWDDAFGVGEALNETAYGSGLVARGKHYLVFGVKDAQTPTLQAKERFLQNQILTPAWAFLSDATNLSSDAWRTTFQNNYSTLSTSLPLNVNLLTFEPWNGSNNFLVRFEHLLEKYEDPQYSQAVKLNLETIFSSFTIFNVQETTLAANQWKKDSRRMNFSARNGAAPTEILQADEGLEFTLAPMQIRTFVIEMNRKH